MRVIAGDLGGRKLKSVSGNETRPTSDKIKESLFQMLGPFFNGGICLDLFAGSGSLGIEAISRGMERACLVDKQRQAISTIYHNIKTLKIEEQTEVLRMDAFQALRAFYKQKKNFNLILVDPPYQTVDYLKLLKEIITYNVLADNGIIYCEHDPAEKLPQSYCDLSIIKEVNYGKTTSITIYRKSSKK